MFAFFKKKKEPPLLLVKVNGKELCLVEAVDIPCEKTPSIHLEPNSVLELIDAQGVIRKHELGDATGWYHFSIRVHPNFACQADCVITEDPQFDPHAFSKAEGGNPVSAVLYLWRQSVERRNAWSGIIPPGPAFQRQYHPWERHPLLRMRLLQTLIPNSFVPLGLQQRRLLLFRIRKIHPHVE